MDRPDRSAGSTAMEVTVAVLVSAVLLFYLFGAVRPTSSRPSRQSQTVQIAHQMGALEFAYAEDNNKVYPYGPDGHTVANLLLKEGYANNPDIFYFAGTPGCTRYTGSTSSYDLTAENCSWDFWMSGDKGLTADANDFTPLCQLTSGVPMKGLPTTAGKGATLTIDPRKTTFGSEGIAVYFKGNNAVFVRCRPVGSSAAENLPTSPVPYVDPAYSDPLGATYHSVLP